MSDQFHFGGYAKTDSNLIEFMRDFYVATGIKLDPIYTAKMMYGVFDDISNGLFASGSRVLAIHTGGLQGVRGIEEREGITIFKK